MNREKQLEDEFPWIEWRKPVPLTVLGDRKGFACRFCIAMIGYKPAEGQMPGFSEIEQEVLDHIEKEHSGKEET